MKLGPCRSCELHRGQVSYGKGQPVRGVAVAIVSLGIDPLDFDHQFQRVSYLQELDLVVIVLKD